MSLHRLISIEPIRDEILYWLTPKDVANLNVALKNSIPISDINKHVNVFKYIIPNRPWLIQKIKEGYKFTVIGSSIHTLMFSNVGSIPFVKLPKEQLSNTEFSTILVVTKDKKIIPCTRNFIPEHLFCQSKENLVSDKEVPPSASQNFFTRVVKINKGDTTISILCPLISTSVYTSIHLSLNIYSSCLLLQNENEDFIRQETFYSNAEISQCTIRGPVKNTMHIKPDVKSILSKRFSIIYTDTSESKVTVVSYDFCN